MGTISSYKVVLLVCIVGLFLPGCSGIQVERMVPGIVADHSPRFKYSLKIVEPVGGQKSVFGVQDYVENPELHAALLDTLASTNFFRSVTDSGIADRELHSEIVAVTASGGLDTTFSFGVRYRVIDPETDEEIWRKEINARHQVKLSETLSGSARAVYALEGAVRKNLAKLVQELATTEF